MKTTQRKKSMTLREVARLAGVSPSSVSRYLNGGPLSDQKRALIRDAIQKTGYYPDQAAHTLRTGKVRQIGVIVPRIHYVINGRGILYADDSNGHTNTFHVHSGEGFMIFPEQVNTYIADMSNPWEYTWIEFDGLRVKQALDVAGFSVDQPIYRTQSQELREKLKNEMLQIVENSNASHFMLIGHLYMFMDYLTRSAENAGKVIRSKMREFYIREAVSYIESNYQKNITIREIAEALRLNTSYFGKIFRLATGKSPQRFLMNYRMIKAAELLTLTKKPINEIGLSVGYENQMHFSRAFRTIYGIPPREWRRKNNTGSLTR